MFNKYRKQFDTKKGHTYNSITEHSHEGEIKPLGYVVRKFMLERVFKMEAQKRVKGNNPFDYIYVEQNGKKI